MTRAAAPLVGPRTGRPIALLETGNFMQEQEYAMPRILDRALRPAATALAVLTLVLAAGCAADRAALSNIRYDLGPAAPVVSAARVRR